MLTSSFCYTLYKLLQEHLILLSNCVIQFVYRTLSEIFLGPGGNFFEMHLADHDNNVEWYASVYTGQILTPNTFVRDLLRTSPFRRATSYLTRRLGGQNLTQPGIKNPSLGIQINTLRLGLQINRLHTGIQNQTLSVEWFSHLYYGSPSPFSRVYSKPSVSHILEPLLIWLINYFLANCLQFRITHLPSIVYKFQAGPLSSFDGTIYYD